MGDFESSFLEETELNQGMSNDILDADHIHRYPAKMTPKIANYVLKNACNEFDKEPDKIQVFDPFCGSGTTLLVARSYGFSVSGVDILRVPVLIAKAKLTKLNNQNLKRLQTALDLDAEDIQTFNGLDSWENRDIWFKDEVYGYLMSLRDWINTYQNKYVYPALFTALSQVVWDVSAADSGVIVPTRSKRSPVAPDFSQEEILEKFKKRVEKILLAQKIFSNSKFPNPNVKLSTGDSKNNSSWPIDNFDLVITSPPYGDGINYRRAVSLQTRFFGLENEDDGEFIRKTIIGRASYHHDISEKTLPNKEKKSRWVTSIRSRSEKRLESILSYVQDIRLTFRELREKINPQGKAIFVIGHPEVSGIKVPLSRVLVNIAEEEEWQLAETPICDSIKNRVQTPIRRSSTNPISEEYILQFRCS
ncbi:MAG: hypothetical protein GF416_00280 [Candidatus Altiarchaeales archaeon]|nr:hypothetical protein [Candidatus Altiarchaeales archaeon]MBD3415558.1 hypothetical protein [Candidatus Altiarchaeales archaeon]